MKHGQWKLALRDVKAVSREVFNLRLQDPPLSGGFWFFHGPRFALYTPLGYHCSMHKSIQQRTLRRLRIVEGQVRGLQKMVEDEKYCVDIINQSLAVKQALSGVEDLILENRLSTHIIEQIKSGNTKKPKEDIMQIYKLSKKK